MSSMQALISDYIGNSKKHGEATLSGDSKVANIAYDKMIEVVKRIHELDSEGKVFLGLLKHENESVKLWSATHALFINEPIAIQTLQEIAKNSGIFSFSASMVVEEWGKGALESPF